MLQKRSKNLKNDKFIIFLVPSNFRVKNRLCVCFPVRYRSKDGNVSSRQTNPQHCYKFRAIFEVLDTYKIIQVASTLECILQQV